MALRDRLQTVAPLAILATSAIHDPVGRQAAPRIATIATIASLPADAENIRAGMARLWTRLGWIGHPDYPEAVQEAQRFARVNPGAALASLRAEGVL